MKNENAKQIQNPPVTRGCKPEYGSIEHVELCSNFLDEIIDAHDQKVHLNLNSRQVIMALLCPTGMTMEGAIDVLLSIADFELHASKGGYRELLSDLSAFVKMLISVAATNKHA